MKRFKTYFPQHLFDKVHRSTKIVKEDEDVELFLDLLILLHLEGFHNLPLGEM
jgi:hypothetical protein